MEFRNLPKPNKIEAKLEHIHSKIQILEIKIPKNRKNIIKIESRIYRPNLPQPTQKNIEKGIYLLDYGIESNHCSGFLKQVV